MTNRYSINSESPVECLSVFGGGNIIAGLDNGDVLYVKNNTALNAMPEVKKLVGHTDRVKSVAYSMDYDYFVTGSRDATVRLWNATTLECVKIMNGHTKTVVKVAISDDNKQIASASFDGTVRLWDVQSGECVKTINNHGSWISSADFSFDCDVVVCGSIDNSVRAFRLSTGEFMYSLSGHCAAVTSIFIIGIAFITGCDDRHVRMWTLFDGSLFKSLDVTNDHITSVSTNSSMSQLLIGTRSSTVVKWNTATDFYEYVHFPGQNQYNNVALSHYGNYVAMGSRSCNIHMFTQDISALDRVTLH